MSKDQPAGEHGNAGFQAEDQGGYGRVHAFLTDDLQGVGNSAGHNSGIEDRNFGCKDACEIRTFKEQGREPGEDTADQELDAGHFYAVYQR